ncbi:hypothetical protein HgNV_032 [Homarus gammarus nudivirus]|uniref:Uncharacterized protein n=1 Tax=Homarus gammarus nudivirus TaxID=2509616 RepID=A0A411HB80_9VIRU|nr:hypothetical protein KM727_gp32 [Homarus gammarus nudivirus]QBB28637.1 hypothetical protein HgNV_032 [Homarus gammarus nudivirus]
MSDTTCTAMLIKHLATLDVSERQYCVKLYLSRNIGPYYIPVTISNTILRKHITPNNLPLNFSHRKYEMIMTILEYMTKCGGVVDKKCILQLNTDFSATDITELFYHLYKAPPTDKIVKDILYQYSQTFKDPFFEAITHSTSGNVLDYIVECDKDKTKFITKGGLTVGISKSIGHRKLLKLMREYVDNNFIVNNKIVKKKNLVTFVIEPSKEPIQVELYNNFIISIL